jgi:hypothetical protein
LTASSLARMLDAPGKTSIALSVINKYADTSTVSALASLKIKEISSNSLISLLEKYFYH